MNLSMKISILALAVLAASGCTGSGPVELHKSPNVEVIQDMMESPALKPQDFDTFDRLKGSSRLPPAGTIAQGREHYAYKGQPELAEKNLKNPYSGKMSAEVIELGRTKFETYCAVCHGYEGKGDGPVSVKMAVKPPTLLSEKVLGYNDGRIFHVITDGQGVMSSYAYQMTDPNDRWAVVNYVRSLQKLASADKPATK